MSKDKYTEQPKKHPSQIVKISKNIILKKINLKILTNKKLIKIS